MTISAENRFSRPGRPLRAAALAAAVLLAAGCSTPPPPPRAVVGGIPPVVQKSPVYCAPASLSRLLAFAEKPVPQGTLALYGGCSPEGGSDIDSFYRMLGPLLREKGFRLRPVLSIDPVRAFSLARRYNDLARPRGMFPLAVPDDLAPATVDLARLFGRADAELLREAAAPRLPAFRKAVRREISAWRPLLWGVVLGVVPEPKVEGGSRAGHLRLIVGYENGGETILYSDPWAPDCPVKRMDAADACAITQSLHVLEPL